MNGNNVIIFPKVFMGKVPEAAPTKEDVKRDVEMMKLYRIQETIINITPMIFNQLQIAGFDLSEEEVDDLKDGAFVIESLKSIMCKHSGIYHPFQSIAESVFHENPEDANTLKMATSVNVEFDKTEFI